MADLEILTCSAEDYAKSQGRQLTSYILVGLSTEDIPPCEPGKCWSKNKLRIMAKEKGCEVIIAFSQFYDSYQRFFYYVGTGMILQNDKQKLKGEP